MSKVHANTAAKLAGHIRVPGIQSLLTTLQEFYHDQPALQRRQVSNCNADCEWVTQTQSCVNVTCDCDVVWAAGTTGVSLCANCLAPLNSTLADEIVKIGVDCGVDVTAQLGNGTTNLTLSVGTNFTNSTSMLNSTGNLIPMSPFLNATSKPLPSVVTPSVAPSNSSSSMTSTSGPALAPGAIAGIVAGITVGSVVFAVVALRLIRRHQRHQQRSLKATIQVRQAIQQYNQRHAI